MYCNYFIVFIFYFIIIPAGVANHYKIAERIKTLNEIVVRKPLYRKLIVNVYSLFFKLFVMPVHKQIVESRRLFLGIFEVFISLVSFGM